MAIRVVLIDAGTGNLRSVQHALLALGADVLRTDNPSDLKKGERLVLPGVGAFGRFMQGMNQSGLSDAIRESAQKGIPILGICVGMQSFFDVGLEMGEFSGLGLIRGQVRKFLPQPGLKIPQTGWNQFKAAGIDPLLKRLDDNSPYAYFNHSYYCDPQEKEDVLATTDYGITYASAIHHQNLYGVQFHPEKSQKVGLTLLNNFLNEI